MNGLRLAHPAVHSGYGGEGSGDVVFEGLGWQVEVLVGLGICRLFGAYIYIYIYIYLFIYLRSVGLG